MCNWCFICRPLNVHIFSLFYFDWSMCMWFQFDTLISMPSSYTAAPAIQIGVLRICVLSSHIHVRVSSSLFCCCCYFQPFLFWFIHKPRWGNAIWRLRPLLYVKMLLINRNNLILMNSYKSFCDSVGLFRFNTNSSLSYTQAVTLNGNARAHSHNVEHTHFLCVCIENRHIDNTSIHLYKQITEWINHKQINCNIIHAWQVHNTWLFV